MPETEHPIRVGDIWCHKRQPEYEVMITAFYATVIYGHTETTEEKFREEFKFKTSLRPATKSRTTT